MSSDDDDSPRGLVAGDAFLSYMDELRETWPRNEELEAKHGLPSDIGPETMSQSEAQTDSDATVEQATTEQPATIDEPSLKRRRFMQAAGATAATLAIGTSPAAAAGGGLNYQSDLTPDPYVRGTVSVNDVVVEDGPLAYTDNSGNDVSLEDVGGQLAEREDDTTPHNPVTFSADEIDAADFVSFPRGETYDDDGDTSTDEIDLDAIDATHWSTDVSSSAGSMTVENQEPASGGRGLRVSTSSQTSGDTAMARFTDVSLSSGELRRYLQTGLNVPTLDSGTVVEIRVEDSTGSQTAAVIDSSADSTAASTIATSTVTGDIYQAQLGDLTSTMDGIEAVEIAIMDGNAQLDFFALNVERESRWSFGENEYKNSDDELETETVSEPRGETSIVGLSSMGSTFSSATINPLDADVELRAAGSPDSYVDDVEADPGRFRYDNRLEVAQSIEIPSAYDLSWSGLELVATVRHPADRYNVVKSAVGLEDAQTVADVEDVSTTDRTSDLEGGSIDDEIVVESTPSPGEFALVYHDLLLTGEEYDEITSPSAIGGGMVGGSGGGGLLSSPRGILGGIAAGAVGYLGIVRGWFGSLLGGS